MVGVIAETIQARYLLRPGPEVKRRVVGGVARAKSAYDVKVHAVACLLNHISVTFSGRRPSILGNCYNRVTRVPLDLNC